jgi:hypothetical protein
MKRRNAVRASALVVGALVILGFVPRVVGAPTAAPTMAQAYPEDVQAWADRDGLTFSEAAARADARAAISPVVEQINTDTDTFTGLYFTNGERYTLHIVVKEGAKPPALSLPKSDTLDVVWETAPRSQAELDKLRAQLLADFAGQDTFVSLGTDLPKGRLILTLTADADLDAVRASYGDFADVEAGTHLHTATCTDELACTPWRGALYITNGAQNCSYGISIKGASDNLMKMMTAAHCDSGTFSHNGVTIGTTSKWYLGPPSYGDYQRTPRTLGSTPRNRIYYNESQKSYPITSVTHDTQQNDGDSVHLDGFSSLTKTTTITDRFYQWGVYYQGTLYAITGAKAGVSMGQGDSGGPVFYGGGAMGMISSTDFSTFTAYTLIDFIQDDLSATTCITDSCGL